MTEFNSTEVFALIVIDEHWYLVIGFPLVRWLNCFIRNLDSQLFKFCLVVEIIVACFVVIAVAGIVACYFLGLLAKDLVICSHYYLLIVVRIIHFRAFIN